MQTTRLGLRAGAVIGAASLAALASAPAFAADPASQATAQSLHLTVAGQSGVSQVVTATNDGTTQSKNDASTIPTIAGLLPGNNALGAGVAPQDAGANADGTSYACAGIAGTGGGIVHTGSTACDIDGAPLTLTLGSLNLGSVALDPNSALGAALAQYGSPLLSGLNTLISSVQSALVAPVTGAVSSTPLNISLGGTVSAIEATCTATPASAQGTAHLVDSQGGSANTPIKATVAGQTVTVLDLPANPPPNTHLLTNLDTVSATLVSALKTELNNSALGSALQPLVGPLGTTLDTLQSAVVDQLVKQLQPLLQPLQQNVLDVTLNKQVSSEAGRKIDVTALDLQVLPAASAFTGSSLVSGQVGEVTCGPGADRAVSIPQASTHPAGSADGDSDTGRNGSAVPTAVDAGLSGDGGQHGHTALVAGLGGLIAAGAAGTAFVHRRRLFTK
ncbi:hypothetical protein P5P86_18475 [Nocardioides sp. BP30]|uniref:hypothetical protein n=1 Tax=Nocardioides sp. BP30 TaxID=3036374 RepID=UPI002469C17C|nr:hypothetical protein [Nocardioides sp. BP30]WGL51925.1 hypothetical protein P5P86_18475 [Nocardioides sp. BP30]